MSTARQRILLALLLIDLASCQMFPLSLGATPIKTVKLEWSHYPTVQIQGRIVERVRLLDSWVYAVQDSTGKIWVLTDQLAPQLGERVRLRGKVRYQAVTVGSQDLGEAYIVEGVRLKITAHP